MGKRLKKKEPGLAIFHKKFSTDEFWLKLIFVENNFLKPVFELRTLESTFCENIVVLLVYSTKLNHRF